jgi:hypothetical protein
MLLLGVGVLILILVNRIRIKRLPESKILVAGFCVLLTGWAMTVLECFFWESFLNYVEHICYAVSSLLVLIWFWKVFASRNEVQ